MNLVLVGLLEALGLKVVVLLEDALAAATHVAGLFAEVTVVFEDLVEAEQAVDLVLLLQQFLLERLDVGLDHFSLLSKRAQGHSRHTLSCQIVRVDPQRGDTTQVYQTHVDAAEPQVSSVYWCSTRLCVPSLPFLLARCFRFFAKVDDALHDRLPFVER